MSEILNEDEKEEIKMQNSFTKTEVSDKKSKRSKKSKREETPKEPTPPKDPKLNSGSYGGFDSVNDRLDSQ